MYIQLQSSYQIVSLPDDYLTLKEVDGENLTFELKYMFDQEIGIKQNITNVHIEIAKKSPPKLAIVNDSRNLVADIQRQKNAHIQLIKSYVKNDLLATVASDPTKSISNEVVPLFKRGYTASQLPQLLKRVLMPVRIADARNYLPPVNAQHDVGNPGSAQQLAEQLLLLGHDPSSAYKINNLGLSQAEAHRGIRQNSPSVFNSLAEKILYKYKILPYLKPINQHSAGDPGIVLNGEDDPVDQYTLERVTVESRHVSVLDILKFNLPSTSDRLTLVVKVKNNAGVTVQVLERIFSPREYIKYYSIPTQPPIVLVNNQANKTHVMLAIKQVDPAATGVRIYKRLYDHNTFTDEPYVFVNALTVSPTSGWVYIPVDVSLGNTNIYRVIPTSALGTYGCDFATAVVRPKMRNATIKRVVITTKPQLKGVLLEISKLPSDCVSFQIIREDVTIDKGTKEFVQTPVRVESNDANRVYTFTDIGVKPNHLYMYYCRIFRKTGSHEDRLAANYEHIPLVENIVETKIKNSSLHLTDRGFDVQFTIETTVVSTNVDLVKQLLERQGLYEIFKSDIADVRDQLEKLIAHNVKRVDLTTGAVEDFGTVQTVTFSDLEARNVAGVSDLRIGHKYRYIVTALLRAPETLLESYVKTSRDVLTNREYSYKPFKFLHPVVAKYGNIVTPSSIRANYSKNPMTFGEIGSYTIIEVALDKQKSIITTAIREKKGSNIDVLQWVLNGTSKDVDHFQVIVEHGGKKNIVGKVACVPETDNFVYVRKLDSTEVGLDLRYSVCPVYHDFTRGLEVLVSNTEYNS